jgi:hypothetical protein
MKVKLFVFVLIVIQFGCSKSDTPAPAIVGSWKYASAIKTSCTISTDNSTDLCSSSCTIITFNSNGTFTFPGTTGTYTITGNKIALSTTGNRKDTFSIVGTILTVVEDKDSFTGCIRTTTFVRQ